MARISHLRDPECRRPGFYPPAGSRFVEYGPEDRLWMEPLGIGDVVYFDLRVRRDFGMPLLTPFPTILLTTV